MLTWYVAPKVQVFNVIRVFDALSSIEKKLNMHVYYSDEDREEK